MITDALYQRLLHTVHHYGEIVNTRNALTKSHWDVDPLRFITTPLVTLRKTAWKMAIREMEWFMSGDAWCPDELLPWWQDQLGARSYRGGYSNQFRRSGYNQHPGFDQVKALMEGLRDHPNSRRLVMTTWNPFDMANITTLNKNVNTPACCHGSFLQAFVRQGKLFITHYQRSADLILGAPHNFIQYWALLLYLAYHAGLLPGGMKYLLGDAHLYLEASHLAAVQGLLACTVNPREDQTFQLVYQPNPGDTTFRASDFYMDGDIPEPQVFTKPKLL